MDLVCFSHLRWGFVFQRPNHLMSRFSRHYRVFYVEEPLFDDDPRGPWIDTEEVAPNLTVCTAHLPRELRRGVEGGTSPDVERAMQQLLRAFVVQHDIEPDVVWFYTPMAFRQARELRPHLVVYDCMDELSAFMNAPRDLLERERELMSAADVVFTGGHALYERKRRQHPNVHAFPSSVDAEHFARARGGVEEPEDQSRLPHPRIGYFGAIDERIDLQLIEKVAEARPDWHLSMIGPVVKIDPASLPRRDNIHWLGPKLYAELPSYIAHWDVALMPFALNEATRYISPTKTLEYLAAGKPVVSTAIADVVHPYGHDGVVSIADHANIVPAIECALHEGMDPLRASLVLAGTSWDRTFAAMNGLMQKRMGATMVASESPLHV